VRTPVEIHICGGRTVPAQTRGRKGRLLAVLAVSTIIASGFATQSLADKKNDAKTTTPLKHLVIIFGENISFDHYFATYPLALNPDPPFFSARDDTPAVNGLSPASSQTIRTCSTLFVSPPRMPSPALSIMTTPQSRRR
jgi:phospholipase C